MKQIMINFKHTLEKKNIQLHYMDTDSFVLSINKIDFIKDSKNLKEIFDFSNLKKNREIFSEKTYRYLVISK